MPKNLDAVGRRHAPGRALWLLGPAMVAGVAYLDPGNVASNMTAGATFGYLLVWVVVLGNVMAWLIQYLSAKLGIVTGESLPQILGRRMHRPWGRRLYWLQAEAVAMATDVAEVIGGAVALHLLFDVPLVWGGAITGVVSMIVLAVALGALTVLGAAIFLRYSLARFLRMWLLRQLFEGQANTDRIVDAVSGRN